MCHAWLLPRPAIHLGFSALAAIIEATIGAAGQPQRCHRKFGFRASRTCN